MINLEDKELVNNGIWSMNRNNNYHDFQTKMEIDIN